MKPHFKVRRPRLAVLVPMKRKPDANMVEMLGEFYQALQGGEISGLAVCATSRDGSIHSGFVTVGVNHIASLIGATEYLAHRIKNQALQMA